jgi:YVTN family beta-propeller protein
MSFPSLNSLLAGILLFTFPVLYGQTNTCGLIQNSSFEEGLANWGVWSPSVTLVADAHTGAAALSVPANTGFQYATDITVTPGQIVTASAWAKVSGGQYAALQLQFRNASGDDVGSATAVQFTGAAYEQKSATLAVPATATRLFLNFWNGNNTSFIIDDVCVTAVTPITTPVASVGVFPSALTLTAGATLPLNAVVLPADATNRSVTWSSSAPAIASINSTTGLLAAVSPGTATLTATTTDGARTATATLTVLKPASAFLNSTPGFLNLARAEAPGTLLSHPHENDSEAIGRTTVLQYINGWLVVGAESAGNFRPDSDYQLRVYDISDPAKPLRRLTSDFGLDYKDPRTGAALGWHYGNYGWGAHGSAQLGSLIVPDVISVPVFGGPVERGGTTSIVTDQKIPEKSTVGVGANRSSQAGPWEASFPWYGSSDGDFTIRRVTNTTGFNSFQTLATFDHTGPYGGGDWHPMFFGDLLIYVSGGDANRDGIVVYRLGYNDADPSDPASPLGSITPQPVASLDGGFQAYWATLFSDGSGLYVVGSDTEILMVANITGASAPPDAPASDNPVHLVRSESMRGQRNATYPVYQDNFAFIHNRKIDMTRFIVNDPTPVELELNEDARIVPYSGTDYWTGVPGRTAPGARGAETSQMSLALGNLWITGGFHQNRAQGMSVWVHQQEPDTTPPRVTYHIPQAGRTAYPRHAPLSFLLPEQPRHGGPRNGIDFTVRPVIPGANGAPDTLGLPVSGMLIHDFSGVLTFTPSPSLARDTTYQVDFLGDNRGTATPSDDIGFVDAAGNLMDPYNFRFSTGSAVNATPPPVIDSFTAGTYQPTPGSAFTVTASATGTAPLQYRFNFNGTWTAWSDSPEATHTYAETGRYRVFAEVRDADGNIVNSTFRVLVSNPPPAATSAPTQSSTLAIGDDPAGRRLWVVNPDSDTVTVLDAATGAKRAEHSTGPGSNPRSIARDNQGRYWVTCHRTDQILVFNHDGTIAHTLGQNNGLPYGSAPYGIAPSPDGQSLFVTLHGSARLLRYSAASPATAPTSINTPFPTPRALAVANNGNGGQRILVTRFLSADQQGQIGDFTFTASPAALASTRVIPLDYAYTTDGGDRAAGVPNHLAAIAISPDGTRAAVVSKQDNVHRGTFYGVGALTHETTLRAVVSFIDLSTHAEIRHTRRDFDNSADPSALTYSPLGDTLFIALQGNDQVVGLDALTLNPALTTDSSVTNATLTSPAARTFELATGAAPQGVLIDPVTKRLFTQNFIGRSVTLHDATPFLGQNLTNFPPLAASPVTTVSTELLSAQVLSGKKIFYNASDPRMSADSYISCASCHADGGHDGRVWDFTSRGEGFRRTTDLRGRSGTAHGNLHWSGNFDEVQDFEHDIRGPFGGTGFLPLDPATFSKLHPSPASTKAGLSPELDDLAAYVASLAPATTPRSPHRESNGTLSPAAVRGQAIFTATDPATAKSCASCHTGSALTDSTVTRLATPTLHDVGTLAAFSGLRLNQALEGIDTPTLQGLHTSRVYLHHGQASSLADVFGYAGGALHFAKDAQRTNLPSDALRIDNPDEGGGGNTRGVLGQSFVRLSGTNTATLRFNGINGGLPEGPGGAARLAIRYLAQLNPGKVDLIINDAAPVTLSTLVQQPDTKFQFSGWRWLVVDITLAPGTANTITLRRKDSDVAINALLVANADDLAATIHHRRVLSLTSGQQNDLVSYLNSLDYRDASGNLPNTPPAAAPTLTPAILTPPQSALLAATNPLSLYVVATGTGPFTYQWTRSGTPVGGNSPLFELPSAKRTDAGVYRVRVTNSAGSFINSAIATVTVNSYLAITTGSLPVGTVGRPYSFDLAATGGIDTRTWSLAPGQHLPAGLTLTPGGQLTGTPTAPARDTVTFRVSDTSGSTTRAIPITIRPVGGFTTDSDLLLHYTFDEGSGARVWDSSTAGNDHSTTLPDGVTWTPAGRFGGAYGVPGSLNTALTPFVPANQSDLDFDPRSQGFTLALWFRTTSTQGYHNLLAKNGSESSNRTYQYLLGVGQNGPDLRGISGDVWGSTLSTTAPAINNGEWHHAALVNYLEGTTWRTRLYLNGGTTFRQLPNPTRAPVPELLRIGEALNISNSSWKGHLDDLRIYRRALSSAEITALYTAPNTLPPSYDSWIVGLANPPAPAHRAPSATAPGAYLPNLLAYAFDLDPFSAASVAAQPRPVLSGNRLQLTLTRHRSDLNYIVEASSNLVTWTSLAHNPGTLGATTTVQDTVTLGSTQPRRFLRIRVEER